MMFGTVVRCRCAKAHALSNSLIGRRTPQCTLGSPALIGGRPRGRLGGSGIVARPVYARD